MGWAVVEALPMAEEVAERAIRSSGFAVFLPRYAKLLRGVRVDPVTGQRVRTRKAGEIVLRPLFRGYLFAELHPDQGARAIAVAHGVKAILRRTRNGEPEIALLDDRLIAEIRSACDAGKFDEVERATKIRRDILPTDTVRVELGVFSGFIGQLEGLDDKGRARVLLDLVGRKVLATVPAESLALVAAAVTRRRYR